MDYMFKIFLKNTVWVQDICGGIPSLILSCLIHCVSVRCVQTARIWVCTSVHIAQSQVPEVLLNSQQQAAPK